LAYRPLFLPKTCLIEIDLQLSKRFFEADVATSAKFFRKRLLVFAIDHYAVEFENSEESLVFDFSLFVYKYKGGICFTLVEVLE